MHLIQEQLSRAHRSERLREAEIERRSRTVTAASRLSRRAEQAARRARLAAARM